MTRILYLAHDLDDAAIWRRVEMLRLGGAEVTIAGFRRSSGDLQGNAIVLGQTHNARMVRRAFAILRQRFRLHSDFLHMQPPDAILCRNLEMLSLGVPLRQSLASGRRIPLVYEALDIHRLLVGKTWNARGLRWIERRLCRDIDRLIVSSPAFLREYFEAHGQNKAPVLLVENRVVAAEPSAFNTCRKQNPADLLRPLRIGWFGILRCRFSLDCLDAATRVRPGHYRAILRGRPALDVLPDFHQVIEANPDLTYEGPYSYPGDLAKIYDDVDLAWLVDRYDTGRNSDWLLPNRLYESGLNGVPPIALEGTEVANRMRELGIGIVLQKADVGTVVDAIDALSPEALDNLRQAQNIVEKQTWMVSKQDAYELVERIACGKTLSLHETHHTNQQGVLVVVPTLNEAAHIARVIEGLVPFLIRRRERAAPTRLVIVDGGSSDGTRDIVEDRINALSQLDIQFIGNPARVQSAGINLACATVGDDMDWLIRLDAHSIYPEDYPDVLLDEACRTGAESVVVAMNAIGTTPLQCAIAMTQNSRLGNGAASHRIGNAGRFVDHGHHALMRLDTFRFVRGYDESFSHNEDAELDLRLSQAGYRIWLTSRTGLDYVPRKNIACLFRQYFNFGRGRARTMLKHSLMPRLRQMAMIVVAPLVASVAITPLSPLFALPAATWMSACLAASVMLALAVRNPLALAVAPIAMVMHLAWSVGFWRQLLEKRYTSPPIALPFTVTKPVIDPTEKIAVGICTFQRSTLTDTLHSLEEQILTIGISLTIIVIDNDKEPSARGTVVRFAARSRHDVVYRHAPHGNISIARNAALEEAERRRLHIFAFIDDDELAPSNWLSALVARLELGDADVVVGPVRAIYPPDAPRWMQLLRTHDTYPKVGPDGRPIVGYSGNVIMDLRSDALSGRRFSLERGVSGGEDTAFFGEAVHDGARLALAPLARVDEPVTSSRASLGWLLKRRFRMGQTHGSLLRKHKGAGIRLAMLPLAIAKAVYCATLAILTLPFSAPRNANLLRGALHVGTVASLIGLREVEVYGQESG